MSDALPFEIQAEIIKRLPIKLLVQFRSVSKAWKSLIDSDGFIKHYSNQQRHLLVRYAHRYVLEPKYVSIVDDDSFPNHRVSLIPPPLVNMLKSSAVIGSSHGLLCLSGYYDDGREKRMVVVWNISIRKAIAVALPNAALPLSFETVVGFGVCRETKDTKIVKITHIASWKGMESIPDSIPWQVEVFTLSTGVWRCPYNTNLPRKSIQLGYSQGVDGFIYWLSTDMSTIVDGDFESYNLIISFDLRSEEFKEVNLPDNLVYYRSMCNLYISNLRESLVVLDDENGNHFVVWRMEDGARKSFAKLFTIYVPNATIIRVLDFRKSGEPVVEIVEDRDDPLDDTLSLVVYKPNSKQICNLGINGIGSFDVYSYMETLLLLDQPEFTVFDNGKRYTF